MNLSQFDEEEFIEASDILNETGEEEDEPQEGENNDPDGSENGDSDQNEDKGEDLDAEFEEQVMNGKFKAQFDARVQSIINKRFKETKQLETSYEEANSKLTRVEQRLLDKYGVKTLEEAEAALEEETISNKAYESGQTEEEVRAEIERERYTKDLEAKNKKLETDNLNAIQKQQYEARVNKWRSEEAELQTLYPNFKLLDHVDNDNFVRVLKSGVSMQQAYEVAFPKEYAKRVQGAVSKDIRPKENAQDNTKKGNYSVSKRSAETMTKEDRAKLIDQVRKGKKIKL